MGRFIYANYTFSVETAWSRLKFWQNLWLKPCLDQIFHGHRKVDVGDCARLFLAIKFGMSPSFSIFLDLEVFKFLFSFSRSWFFETISLYLNIKSIGVKTVPKDPKKKGNYTIMRELL